jgi:hypothetical protein
MICPDNLDKHLTDYLDALSGNAWMISTSLDGVSQHLAWDVSEYLNKHLAEYLDALLLGYLDDFNEP